MTKLSLRRVLLASACSLALTTPAFAQDQVAAEEDGDTIIVTAQNRSQNVNDVPIAIDVLSPEKLAAAGFSDANDLGKIAPVVQINQDQGTVKITVRGIGTNSADEAQDTSVVANIDGEYVNRPNALSVALFDLDRVEVLRGPQGTLYGRNSTGGAINFITRKPGNDFGINASASYGNYNAMRFDAGVDVPLGDIGGVRFAGFYDERDGYVKHPAHAATVIPFFPPLGGPVTLFPAYDAGRSDDNQSYGGRATLKLDPTDALSITLSGEYAEKHFRPQIFASGDLNAPGNGPSGPGCNAQGFEQVAGSFPETVNVAGVPTLLLRTLCIPTSTNLLSTVDRGQYAAPNFGLGTEINQETWAIRGRIAYEFSDAATLSYIAGYRDFNQGDPNGNEYRTLPVVYRSYTFLDDAQTQSHELRLNGVVGGVTYQVGGFYFKEELQRESGFLLPSFIFATPLNDPTLFAAPGTFLSYFGRDISSESKSVFGQVEVPLGETLTAVGGLRYTDNKRSAIYLNAGPFGPGAPDRDLIGAGPARKDFSTLSFVQTLPLGSSEDKITWLAGLNWKPDSDTLVYAKVSTGFKGGGFDAVGTYKPETNMAYETGLKKSFGDAGQHQFNASAFYYDYKDLQVSVLLDTAVGGQIFNAGKAKIFGFEAQANIELSENDHFDVSFNYLNAEYKELLASFNAFCINNLPATTPTNSCGITSVGDIDPNTAGVQQPNFAGNRPPFSPEFIVTVGYDHVFDMGGAGTLTARADSTFKSSYFTDFYNRRDGQQKAFSQTNLSLVYKPENEKFSVAAFARNLENTRPLTYGGYTAAGPDDIFNWQFGTPRTYGVRVSVDF
jgi:iron complex outermembrane recepter protein